jgi:hypothetical protein
MGRNLVVTWGGIWWCLSLNLTPKALANFSPGFELSENPGIGSYFRYNPERVRLVAEPFQGSMALLIVNPGFSLSSNPGLKLANAFGVIFKLIHYLPV